MTPAGHVVSWYVGDLPPRATASADEEFTVLTDEILDVPKHTATVEEHERISTENGGVWTVPARAVDHVFRGSITVTCRQKAGQLAVWRRGRPHA